MTETAPGAPPEPALRSALVGWAAALLSIVAFSVSTPVSKALTSTELTPTTLLVLRYVMTVLLLGGTALSVPRDQLRMGRRGLAMVCAAGLANGIGNLSFFWSLTRLSASVASMLYSLTPLATLGLLALRGEPLTRRNTVRLALGLGGTFLLLGPAGSVDWPGALLVLVSILGSSVQMVLIQWYLTGYDTRALSFYLVAAMGAVFVGTWLIEGRPWRSPTVGEWAWITVMAVVSTYLARLLWVAAIRRVGTGQGALLIPLEILLTVIWSIVFLRERLTIGQWVGGGLTLTSTALASRRLSRARLRPS